MNCGEIDSRLQQQLGERFVAGVPVGRRGLGARRRWAALWPCSIHDGRMPVAPFAAQASIQQTRPSGYIW